MYVCMYGERERERAPRLHFFRISVVQTFDVLIIRTVTGAGTNYSDHVVNYNDFGGFLKKLALTSSLTTFVNWYHS